MTFDEKIESKKKAIEKLEKKIERIKKAFETGKNPYYYDEDDLTSAERDLAYEKKKLEELHIKKANEDNVKRIPVIENFLEDWKQKAIEWYKEDYRKLLKFKEEYQGKRQEFEQWKKDNGHDCWRVTKETEEKEKELGIDRKTYLKQLNLCFNSLTLKLQDYGLDWQERLEQVIEREKVNKRKLLILRVEDITGEITDATGLYIGQNAEINGIVIGKKGKAKVETISAGGYNIQCFHYRVLVKRVD